MARILYVHWNKDELDARAAPLRAAGHTVHSHWSQGKTVKLGKELPNAVVISLDRLPSHGRAIAEWFSEAKKRQHVPILFAGGLREKVAETRTKFPEAIYCGTDEVVEVLEECLPALSVPAGEPAGVSRRVKRGG
jgi:hypothetical protein